MIKSAWARILVLPTLVAMALLMFTGGGKPEEASAHPLGNFTVNRLAKIQLTPDGHANLRYVLDLAEIASFQEQRQIDKDGNGVITDAEANTYLDKQVPALTKKLDLKVGGKSVALTATNRALSFPPGQGGLNTMRLVIDYTGALPEGWEHGVEASFKDGNYTDRIGWRDIVITGADGVALKATSAGLSDPTAELTAYPTEELKSAPDRKEARFEFQAGSAIAAPQQLSAPSGGSTSGSAGKSLNGFAGLISQDDLTPTFIIISLFAAVAWGAAHALGPGHGKTIVAAYLVGSKGNAKQAMVLGASVTFAHMAGVVTLGMLTLAASQVIRTDKLYLWLSVVSALMVVTMGLFLLLSRLRIMLGGKAPGHSHGPEVAAHDHTEHSHGGLAAHAHGHGAITTPRTLRFQMTPRTAPVAHHTHTAADDPFAGHGHSHAIPKIKGWRSIVALGVSAGILPCPTALVVMLGAIALDRIAYGLALVGAFSIGLSVVLTGIGLVLVYASKFFDWAGDSVSFLKSHFVTTAFKAAPVLSALVILAVGIVMSSQSIANVR